MPRSARHVTGSYIFHVLNRAVARLPLFKKERDYVDFFNVLDEALIKPPTRILSHCAMPNHWHFVLWPREDGEVSAFLRWMTHTHAMRWHTLHYSVGTGHLYHGRFRSFPIENDEHLFTVIRYFERNALRSNLIERAEDWVWSSLWLRRHGINPAARLSKWPLAMPGNWTQTEAEVELLRRSVQRGAFGSDRWQARTTAKFGLACTLCPPGRPKK